MASFKDPSFQERVALAGKAKQKALDQLKARPPVDEELMAKRRDERDIRNQAFAKERTAMAEVRASAKAEKASIKANEHAAAEAAVALKIARLKPASPEEMKAARDARYAARQARRR